MPQSADDRSPFSSIDDVISRFAEAGYITDRRLATTIYLVTRLNKPVLLEGPAGALVQLVLFRHVPLLAKW